MIKLIKQVFVTASLLFTPLLVAEPLTPNELHATMGIVTNFILDDEIRFHGKSYKAITSPHTGRVWLDRNIGANRKCASLDDAQCYGDYFQWGRAYDGHESSIDSTTVLATDINNAGAEYIRGNADWASTDLNYGNSRTTNWLKTDGSTVCPVGYRVPLRSELDAEVGDISNKETAYANFLKFPATGWRDYGNANYYDIGTWGTVWSVSSTLDRASYFRFYSISNWNDVGERAYGLSVRCIKHVGKPLIYHSGISYDTVVSPYTGRVWLDRNLGASQVCTAFNDVTCYGDYYQWGRNADGHQDSTSITTNTLATNVDSVGHGAFISTSGVPDDWASGDGAGTIRSSNLLSVDGTSVCPIGFRVPNYTELRMETLDIGVVDRDTAFSIFMKLPSAGHRSSVGSLMVSVGSWGSLWVSSLALDAGRGISFGPSSAQDLLARRAQGRSIRCMQDY